MHSINNVLAASVLALFTTTAQGHMVMATPPPYGSPDNSPLTADGSNFPCKATSNTGATVTDMAIGAPQKLSFLGESVHGGGSCQVSLTTDTPATKSSTWMVIHSIEGGCPAKNVAGNIGADNSASAPDPDTYSFAIPEGIKPGAYTLAWTWFNKVGNREMYMNCASIKVTGGSNKRDDIPLNNETDFATIPDLAGRDTPSFPAMFVANIPVSDCTTAESTDVQFPNPGASVEKDGVASDLAPPTGPKCGSASGSSSSSSGSQAAAPSGGAAAAPSVAASPAAAAAPSVAGSPAAAAAPSSVAASPATGPASSAPAAPAASPPTASTASSSSTSGSGSSGTCSSPGAMLCSPDGKSFAICSSSSGAAPVFQPVSAGTACANGAIGAVKGRRASAKFARGYGI